MTQPPYDPSSGTPPNGPGQPPSGPYSQPTPTSGPRQPGQSPQAPYPAGGQAGPTSATGAYPPPPQSPAGGVPPQGQPVGVPPQSPLGGIPPQGQPGGVPPQGPSGGVPPRNQPGAYPAPHATPQVPGSVPPHSPPGSVPPHGGPAGYPGQPGAQPPGGSTAATTTKRSPALFIVIGVLALLLVGGISAIVVLMGQGNSGTATPGASTSRSVPSASRSASKATTPQASRSQGSRPAPPTSLDGTFTLVGTQVDGTHFTFAAPEGWAPSDANGKEGRGQLVDDGQNYITYYPNQPAGGQAECDYQVGQLSSPEAATDVPAKWGDEPVTGKLAFFTTEGESGLRQIILFCLDRGDRTALVAAVPQTGKIQATLDTVLAVLASWEWS